MAAVNHIKQRTLVLQKAQLAQKQTKLRQQPQTTTSQLKRPANHLGVTNFSKKRKLVPTEQTKTVGIPILKRARKIRDPRQTS